MSVVVAVRLIRFHSTGTAMISDKPEITTGIEAGAAVVVSFLVFLLFPFRGARYVLLLLIGIGVATTTMHNAVHAKPEIFARLFSPAWTEEVVAATEPNSLLVLDQVIPIALPKKEEKVIPTVRRAGKL
jgi:phosphatidylserine synthase